MLIIDSPPYLVLSYVSTNAMSAGFGFSVGDFIAALQLVGTIIDALHKTGNAQSEYQDLIDGRLTLENTLSRLKQFKFEESLSAERIALEEAASLCQNTIDKTLQVRFSS